MPRLLPCALLLLVSGAVAQDKPKIVQVAPTPTNPASGKEMFRNYCAVCHGLDAKGSGPAAPALKMEPADLTTLAKDNKGKFPALKVYNIIAGDSAMPAHGSKDMPIWGDVFRSMSRNESEMRMRLNNLTNYIESIQER